MKAARFLFLLGFGASVAACTVGPDYQTPKVTVPADFVMPPTSKPQTAKESAPAVDAAQWWRSLGDPELNALVDRAIKSSPEIEIALDRLQEARTQEAVVMGEALPSVSASGGAARGTGSDLVRGRAAEPLIAGEYTSGKLRQVTQIVGFDAGWELDLFGKFRREAEAAHDDAQAAAENRNAVLIAVIADVVRSYVDLRSLQMQLAIANRDVATAQQLLDVVQTRFDRGLTNELDLTLSKRELATMKAEIAPLEARIKAAQYVIAVLLGEYPGSLSAELAKPGLIPALPSAIEPGLPLDLLRRRPDIRAAERDLAGATARIGVATANLFPHLALTAGVGMQGQGLGVSPALNNAIWSAGPTAYWNLLDFGTLDALVDLADLRTRELAVNYKETILSAVQNVDTAIGNYAAQQDSLKNLGDALAASERAVALASERYDRGLTDFLNVVDAERQQYALEAQYTIAQQTAADEFVALYRGLGGGWEKYQEIPPIRQPEPALIAMFQRLFAPTDPLK